MVIGIISGLITCALWGLTFVAPKSVSPFSVWDLTVARYTIFGLCCLALMIAPKFRPSGMTLNQKLTGLLLGGVGYVGYFLSAAFAVKLAGPAVPPVIIGTMPIFLALIGNFKDRTVSWGALSTPLCLILVGVLAVNSSAILHPDLGGDDVVWGIAFSFVALVIWIAYGVMNSAIMRRPDAPDGLQWSGLQGIGAAISSLPLLLMTSFDAVDTISAADWYRFIAWALTMGIAGSWLATYCWTIASRRLPLALVAQLIVAETVFGLMFGFIHDERWPLAAETAGALCQIAGVLIAISLFARKQKTRALSDPERNPA